MSKRYFKGSTPNNEPFSFCKEAFAVDDTWFNDHPERTIRLRLPIGSEKAITGNSAAHAILVRQIERGVRVRHWAIFDQPQFIRHLEELCDSETEEFCHELWNKIGVDWPEIDAHHARVLQAIKSTDTAGDYNQVLLKELLHFIKPPALNPAPTVITELHDGLNTIETERAWSYLKACAVKGGWKPRNLNVVNPPYHEPEVLAANLKNLLAGKDELPNVPRGMLQAIRQLQAIKSLQLTNASPQQQQEIAREWFKRSDGYPGDDVFDSFYAAIPVCNHAEAIEFLHARSDFKGPPGLPV
jgi:hypothetical protein